MAEAFVTSELVVPGTYVRVQAEALMPGAAVSTGNIGIVGTAGQGENRTHLLSGYDQAREALGDYDAYQGGAGSRNLTRAVEVLYQNGAGTVFARALPAAPGPDPDDFSSAFDELIKDDVDILVVPELSTEAALAVLGPVLERAENEGRDVIGVVGSDLDPATDDDFLDRIGDQAPSNDRIILTTPGIKAFDAAAQQPAQREVTLSGTYGAAAVAGLLSTLVPQSSPTNKILPGVTDLGYRFSYAEITELLNRRTLVLEKRAGVRVVRGLTTDDGAFKQITTRRIVDYAKTGIRQVSAPFIGRLNNERVRKALQGAIDGFLTSMLVDEALTTYELAVTATRRDEIEGRAMVNVVLQPTFSIDFVAVTLTLQ